MTRLRNFFTFSRKHQQVEHTGRREYRQMAITPEAHARIVALADRSGNSIIDTVDNIMGVKR